MAEQEEEAYVWLGDLSGYQLEPRDDGDELVLTHRCGWEYELPMADWYLGNIVVATRRHPLECQVHVPKPGSIAARMRDR